MKGYDTKLIERVRDGINIPMTVPDGAGSMDDVESIIEKFGIIGVAAGSLFVFKGKYKFILIIIIQILKKKIII